MKSKQREERLLPFSMQGNELNWKEIGLRVGLEIHQQVDSHKLFCNCPSELVDEVRIDILRRLRPTQSELGEVDRAAIEEAKKKLQFLYQAPPTTCLVEADEEPPHRVNSEAIDVALQMALFLGSKLVDEIHFMRKIVIDGSNTTGFQRTALIAIGGSLEVNGRAIPISMVGVEEDAARKIEKKEGMVVYRLDRLGIPLVEVSTDPVIHSPEGAREVALGIGSLLRATKKVKRGIGTIREDLNVSIRDGARVEIKGVQELGLISDYVEKEVRRQLSLIDLIKEMRNRGVREIHPVIVDISEQFKSTECSVIKKELTLGGVVLGIKLQSSEGLLKNRLGPELAAHAMAVGLGGIFHSDELPAYGISQDEVDRIKEALGLERMDAFVILAGESSKAMEAMRMIIERARIALSRVPEETRDPLPDGSTKYSRPLPGKERMYPETDVPPVRITPQRIERIRASLPEKPEVKLKRLVESYGIHRQQAAQIIDQGYEDLFEKLATKFGQGKTAATMLCNVFPELRREGIDVDSISDDSIEDLYNNLTQGKFSKEAIPDILRVLGKEGVSMKEALEKLGLKLLDRPEIERIVKEILDERQSFLEEKGMESFGPLMGVLMERLRGRADGKLASEILREEIRNRLRKE